MFDRVIGLIGKDKFIELQRVKVLVIGIGGVGGYALETLVRSGINSIDIVDFDKIDESNLNRQIITNIKNIGECKVEEAKMRALTINPKININTYQTCLNKDNLTDILSNNYDYVIDACDTVEVKVELMRLSTIMKFKLISSMGTAKKIDASKLCITTLDKTNYDPLARVLRKKIKDLKINKKMYVVCTDEKTIECAGLGSMMMVPAVSGILCAQYVINDILNK